jgi:FKBP-type peptidyl-prolyl cis-trans isomerase
MKVTTETGLIHETIKGGDGPVPLIDQFVTVHYEMALSIDDLINENFIDSTYIRKKAVRFCVGSGEVLLGIDEVIKLMKVGDLKRIIIPPSLAFGERGIKGLIPTNSKIYIDLKLSFIEGNL